MSDGEKPCLMCGDARQVPDAKSWKYYPEDRPCPRCTDGTWEHADRLAAQGMAPEGRGREGGPGSSELPSPVAESDAH